MSPGLDEPALVEHHDEVGVAHGRQPVGDQDPFTLSSGLLRARGYDPLAALAGGVLTNVVHEFFFERWEQPKAIHDLFFMNMLGAIAGAFPGFGMEIGVSAEGQPFSSFYGTDCDGHRWSITFSQHRDYFTEGVPVEEAPSSPTI